MSIQPPCQAHILANKWMGKDTRDSNTYNLSYNN